MGCSTPGLPVHCQPPEFTQTHVHWVSDAIQPSHPLLSPSLPALNLSQHQGLFQWVTSSHQVAKLTQMHSFLWLSSIPLYMCTTASLSILKDIFWYGQFLSPYWICYNIVFFFFMFWFLGPKGMWNLSSLSRNQTCTPALKSKVLTTGPPGKSHFKVLNKKSQRFLTVMCLIQKNN